MTQRAMSKKNCAEIAEAESEIIEVEAVPNVGRFTVVPGDIIRLKRPNAYCKPGKYAVLSMEMTVCLARTKKKKKQRRIIHDLVYIQITDLCFFKRTGKQIVPTAPLNSARSSR